MKESGDKKLTEHIISVFETYDDGGAEQGWLELRKKYPRPARQRYAWLASAAAVLLMAGGLLYLGTGNNDIRNNSQAAVTRAIIKKPEHRTNEASDDNTNGRPSASQYGNRPVTAYNTTSQKTTEKESLSNLNNNLSDERLLTAASTDSEPPAKSVSAKTSVSPYSEELDLTAKTEESLSNTIQPQTLSTKPGENSLAEVSIASEKNISVAKTQPPIEDTINTQVISPKADDFLLVEVNRDQQNSSRQETEKSDRKKLQLSFYAGAFLNYAEGSSNAMNMAAGVSSGIALNKRLSLIAGLAVAKNTLVFENELPNTSYLALVSAEKKGASLFLSGTVPTVSKLEARLLNLDIPVNLKYSLSREPDKVFISAGISSFAYLNEAYRYSYTNFSNGTNSTLPYDDEVIDKNFGKLDLGQTLNFSFGLTQKGRRQSIVLEPFIKYPLSTLGSQDIRFGSAGMNLKLHINRAD